MTDLSCCNVLVFFMQSFKTFPWADHLPTVAFIWGDGTSTILLHSFRGTMAEGTLQGAKPQLSSFQNPLSTSRTVCLAGLSWGPSLPINSSVRNSEHFITLATNLFYPKPVMVRNTAMWHNWGCMRYTSTLEPAPAYPFLPFLRGGRLHKYLKGEQAENLSLLGPASHIPPAAQSTNFSPAMAFPRSFQTHLSCPLGDAQVIDSKNKSKKYVPEWWAGPLEICSSVKVTRLS